MTREEIKGLIREGRISHLPKTGISRGRHRAKSGRRKKAGSRKGGQKPGKEAWVLKIRAIRRHLRWLRDKRQLSAGNYATLLGMAKGGAFRSGSHVGKHVKARQLVKKRLSMAHNTRYSLPHRRRSEGKTDYQLVR